MLRNLSRDALNADQDRRLSRLRVQLAHTEALIVLRTKDHFRIDGEILMLRLRIIDLKDEDATMKAILEDRISWLKGNMNANNSAASYQGVIRKDIKWEILEIEEKMTKDDSLREACRLRLGEEFETKRARRAAEAEGSSNQG